MTDQDDSFQEKKSGRLSNKGFAAILVLLSLVAFQFGQIIIGGALIFLALLFL